MFYQSIAEGSTLSAAAILRMVRGIGLVAPVSSKAIVEGEVPAKAANSRCDKAFSFLQVFNFFGMII